MNIIDLQDNLKNLPENALMKEMQQPTGSAPPFLILGELKRRKQMRDDYNRQQNSDMKTVAEETVTAAGLPQEGIMQASRSLTPKTNMAQNTGIASATPVQPTQAPQPQAPQMMSGGGIMRLGNGGGLSGGTLSAIANLKVMRPDLYEQHKDDPEMLALTAEYYLTVAEDSEMTGLEQLETPRKNDLLKRMFRDPTRGMIKDQQQRDARNFGDDYALDQRAQSLTNLKQALRSGNEGLFAEGAPVDYITGNTSAGFGGSTVPFPAADTPLRDFAGGLGEFTAPELSANPVMPTPSVDRGIKSMSGAANAGMVGGNFDSFPTGSIANAKAQHERDAMFRFLRQAEGTPTDNRSLIDAIDTGFVDSDEAISGDMGIRKGLFFPGEYYPEVDSLNRRAQAYLQSDMYTPPEEIYNFNSPLELLKYEEASDEEFAATSDKLAREAAAGEAATSEASLIAQDVASDADFTSTADRQAEARRMRRINEIPEKGYQSLARQKKEADFNAANPFIAEVIDPIVETSIAGAGLAGRTAADLFGYGADNLPGFIDEVAYARGLGPKAKAERELKADFPQGTEEGLAAASQANKDFKSLLPPKDAGTTTGTSTGTSTGGAGFGSMDSRIAQMLSSRQKEAESDKWMALAMAGMELMKPTSTIGEGFGNAGQAGLGYLQQSKQGTRAFETDMLKLQTSLDIAQQRARSSGLKGGSLTLNQMLTNGLNLLKEGNDMLANAQGNADVAGKAQALIEQGQKLIGIAGGGGTGSGAGEFNLSSAKVG